MPRLPSIRRPPIAFAHRGARAHARENTLEAFNLALRLGATGLESDAWITRDGVVVLDHDGVVRRSARRRPIAQVAAAELPSHIPTLEEFYALCGDTVDVSLDVKDPTAAARVLEVAAACGGASVRRLWLCHHDVEVVASWRGLSDEVRLVDSTRLRFIEEGVERRAARLRSEGVDALNLHHTDWNGGLIALVHRFERLAFAWDAQVPRVIAELLDIGIDAVYSDHVDRLVEALGPGPGRGRP
ncbi:MAG: glycerophosphodiester phosphodiesterase [Actinobacteria bacterium]|nr:glycerophosphodiester phosphodiesterase [Actinomycetota bacterium]